MNIEDLINDKGKTISAKTKESYIKNNFYDDYIMIEELSNRIGIADRTFSEKLYHYFNNLDKAIICKNCNSKVTKYRGLMNGYLDYCSSKCSNSSENVMKLKEESYMKKYGVKNPSMSKDVIEKIQKKFEEKFGGNPAADPAIKEKIRNTCIEKYNDKHPFGKNSILRKSIEEKRELKFREKYKDLNILSYSLEKWGTCTIMCDECGKNYEISKWNLHQRNKKDLKDLCTFCNPIGSKNTTEIESFFKSMLNDHNIKYKKDRSILKPSEIDFLIDDKKIGIEANGIYWHSSNYKSKRYHLDKTEKCLDKGINLIHVFEDEVILKKDIVRSRILSIFGIYEKRLYARKCNIRMVGSQDSNIFLDENHLQGRCGASVRIGLFLDDELVSLMTFSKERKSLGRSHKEGSWELIRFCNKINHLVIGGASKLFNYFINNFDPTLITSFCDRRWSPSTSFYYKLGFNFSYNTEPNYWYYENNSYRKFHRFSFRKDVLVKEGFDPNKTEFEIMAERKFLRVYDCGNSKWEWKKSPLSI